ncbi:winged helix-turn-helix transcriptional regulator [Methylobacterium sp. J-077]|uniref:winged helix-turn-helix transcriptional regulator n=1 Tax=Methylobacterium sp. J-077 TaxID=2836656 RepID=UPI001FBA4511|nr:winged helix-turn-helix transcriptional regulator [Methylobacterium sp. J-077]MCJ2124965.1 winged helix-turn-helix transcriptional regulator [Methylobacterium sp. J-077]
MSHLAVAEGHRLRFSAVTKSIEGITQCTLTLTLRHLERDGLLNRHYLPEVPPAWSTSCPPWERAGYPPWKASPRGSRIICQ